MKLNLVLCALGQSKYFFADCSGFVPIDVFGSIEISVCVPLDMALALVHTRCHCILGRNSIFIVQLTVANDVLHSVK